jgi:hypothetical protein
MNKLFGSEIVGLAVTVILLTMSTVNAADSTSLKYDTNGADYRYEGGMKASRTSDAERAIESGEVEQEYGVGCDSSDKNGGCFGVDPLSSNK